MAITREDFLKKAESLFIPKKQYMMMVRMALDSGIIDLEKCDPDFSAVYPLATAIYEKETGWYLDGSSNDSYTKGTVPFVYKKQECLHFLEKVLAQSGKSACTL